MLEIFFYKKFKVSAKLMTAIYLRILIPILGVLPSKKGTDLQFLRKIWRIYSKMKFRVNLRKTLENP